MKLIKRIIRLLKSKIIGEWEYRLFDGCICRVYKHEWLNFGLSCDHKIPLEQPCIECQEKSLKIIKSLKNHIQNTKLYSRYILTASPATTNVYRDYMSNCAGGCLNTALILIKEMELAKNEHIKLQIKSLYEQL